MLRTQSVWCDLGMMTLGMRQLAELMRRLMRDVSIGEVARSAV